MGVLLWAPGPAFCSCSAPPTENNRTRPSAVGGHHVLRLTEQTRHPLPHMEHGFGRIEQDQDGTRDRAMGETSQISHLEKTLLSRQPRTVPPNAVAIVPLAFLRTEVVSASANFGILGELGYTYHRWKGGKGDRHDVDFRRYGA